MTNEPTFTIQQVAQETDLTVYTLRYYEDIGLLDPITRAANGHRRYCEADIRRIGLLKRLRRTGMTLEDMKNFIDLYREGSTTTRLRRELLEAHRERVEEQIAELIEIREFIDTKIAIYKEEEAQDEVQITG